jgi:hypothetical protein
MLGNGGKIVVNSFEKGINQEIRRMMFYTKYKYKNWKYNKKKEEIERCQ